MKLPDLLEWGESVTVHALEIFPHSRGDFTEERNRGRGFAAPARIILTVASEPKEEIRPGIQLGLEIGVRCCEQPPDPSIVRPSHRELEIPSSEPLSSGLWKRNDSDRFALEGLVDQKIPFCRDQTETHTPIHRRGDGHFPQKHMFSLKERKEEEESNIDHIP